MTKKWYQLSPAFCCIKRTFITKRKIAIITINIALKVKNRRKFNVNSDRFLYTASLLYTVNLNKRYRISALILNDSILRIIQ